MKKISRDALVVMPRQQLIDSIIEQQESYQALAATVEELQFQLDWFKRQVFGSKTERHIPDDELQTALELGVSTSESDEEAQAREIRYKRKKPKQDTPQGHARGTMPTHLPIIRKTIEPDCDTTGLVRIGEDESWYYDMEPASLHVVLITRPKYAKPDKSGIVTADLPALPIEKGNAGPGLQAQITIDKFVYHLPLDRQRKKFKNEYAVTFSESWLCDLVKNTGFWVTPLYEGYRTRLLQADYLCADETPIPILTKDKKGKTHRGYFWVYYDPLNNITVFDYRPSRSRAGPNDFLKDFTGILQVDGYEGYSEIIAKNNILRAACMDHIRRKFEQAKAVDATRSKYALETMRVWYQRESGAKDASLSLEDIHTMRTAQTAPEMHEFKAWMQKQLNDVLPKSGIGMALQYALNQWEYFQPFLTNPRVAISNSATENKIRPVAIGRKNYMFIGSHEAAKRAAMIYSLVAIAHNHSINPYTYFKDILTVLPNSNTDVLEQFYLPGYQPGNKDNSKNT